jgi:hypothetical protein
MSTDNVTPICAGKARNPDQDLDAAQQALKRAQALVDLLQGAAAHGAIEPPANEESLASALGIVFDLLEEVENNIWPAETQS